MLSPPKIFLIKLLKLMLKKHNNRNDDLDNTQEIIDLRKFFHPEVIQLDENGSYTGITKDTYYDGVLEEPIQDADDL